MFGKKKYSEVSETGLNINSDYFKILHQEFESLFVKKNNNRNLNNDNDNDNLNNNNDVNDNIENHYVSETKLDNIPNNKIELNNQDIFYIGLFSKYILNNQINE